VAVASTSSGTKEERQLLRFLQFS